MFTRLRPAWLVILALLALLQPALCGNGGGGNEYVTYTNADGQTVYLANDRRPSLYTGNYGDCLGGSLINVTRFDAAYYQDNSTVLFHLGGYTSLTNESLVMYIGVYAYGEARFDLLFNPCKANIPSLCPLNSSVPIVASGIVPVSDQQVGGIPSIAFSIPDFEGQAILRIFANSTESEIGCYSAVVTNGKSFAQPKSVGTILGVFAFVAMIASFTTAIYGEAVPTMRLHYAHSLSVGVVFAVYQHIFFTGALSMNWPSVLVAWWENFAWAGGMIYARSMQKSIDNLIGTNIGSTSEVGAAPSNSGSDSVGGGYSISQIYKRMLSGGVAMPSNHHLLRDLASEIYEDPYFAEIQKRELFSQNSFQHLVSRQSAQGEAGLVNKADGYRWYGHPIGAGLPLPGNYSGFAGTLAQENIPVSNAFMTGLLWFLILLALLLAAVLSFKGVLELLARFNRIEKDRFKFFRDRWIGYTILVVLRTCYIAFFLMMFLTIFEFTFRSSAGVKAVAGVVFAIFIVGIPGAAAYACYYKKRLADGNNNNPVERKKLLGVIPWSVSKKGDADAGEVPVAAKEPEKEDEQGKVSLARPNEAEINVPTSAVVDNIHDNEDFTSKFGWLASRFRRTRWWFFTAWIFYEFVRAVFYAGASGYPLTQVFGLLVIEFIAFAFIVWARPFEGRRLNVLVVYCLGFSKVTSVALSAAFDVKFNLPRITTTIIGIVVIIIQGVLTIITLIAIAVGAISSYMSISRNREEFRPRKWHGWREKYFDHLDRVVNDLPREPKPKKTKKKDRVAEPVEQKTGFEVKNIKRLAKIEDEDEEFASEMRTQNTIDDTPTSTQPMDADAAYISLNNRPTSPIDVSQIVGKEQRSDTGTPLGIDRSMSQRSGTGTPAGVSRSTSLRSLSQSKLPYGARPSRPSWSAKDFVDFFPPSDGENAHSSFPTSEPAPSAVDDNDIEPSTPQRRRSGHRRTSSLRSNKSLRQSNVNPALKASASVDNLRIGGEVSTPDTIGNVPPPAMRSRPNSFRNSRSSMQGPAPVDDSVDEGDSQNAYQRSSRYLPMMTPAQERDEWVVMASPKLAEEE